MRKILSILILVISLTSCSSQNNMNYETRDYATMDVSTESIQPIGDSEQNKILNEERKIEKNFSVNIETKNYNNDYNKIQELIKKHNALIESSNDYIDSSDENRKSFFATIRIDEDKSEEFYNEVKQIGKTIHASSYVNDITKDYNFNERKINSLKKELESLNKMFETAENYNDIIVINTRINEIQSELDYYEQNKINMDDKVDKNTFNIELQEVLDYRHIEQDNSLSSQMKQAFSDSLYFVKIFFKELLLLIIRFWIPLTLILLIVLYFKNKNKTKFKNTKTVRKNTTQNEA